MNKGSEKSDDLRPEYDFSQGQRGRYADRYAQGTNLIKLDADLHADFPTSDAVNEALRRYRDLMRK